MSRSFRDPFTGRCRYLRYSLCCYFARESFQILDMYVPIPLPLLVPKVDYHEDLTHFHRTDEFRRELVIKGIALVR